jgi:hypothetical protein
MTQQKRTSLYRYHITISKIRIGTNEKMNPHNLCYLCFTGIIQPLNVVWMWVWVWACGQAKLLDQIRTHQVVAATKVNDNTCSPIVDDQESLEQIVPLLLLGLLHLGTKDTLHNNGPVCHHVLDTEGGVLNIALLIMHLGVVDLVLNIRGADVTSVIGGDLCPLARAILFYVTNSLALVTANHRSAACGSDRRGTLGRRRCGRLATVDSACYRCCRCGPRGHRRWRGRRLKAR